MLKVGRQSGGFTSHAPLNRVHPVKFTPVTAKRISLGYPPGVQPGWKPWNIPLAYLLFHYGKIPTT
jgi:hypothetical protein